MRIRTLALALLLPACSAPETDAEPAATPAAAAPVAPTTARELVQAMHDRYADTWYETLTFKQETITYAPGGAADTATWYEAMKSPGRLRIDIMPLEDASGLLFRNDSLYNVRDGAVQGARPLIHPLLVLGFDVYRQPVDVTIGQLEALGYDLSALRDDTWQDRPVWVVGAPAGDSTSVQFWVDKERLLTLRTIRKAGATQESVQDVHFDDYEPIGEAWVSPMMRFYVDGRLATEEVYSEMRRDVALPDALFDPTSWRLETPYWN